MVRHSKNSTGGSVFTYAERQKLDYGTKVQRLGAESMAAFGSCHVCLRRAERPTACSQGHVACKECVCSSLLAQKLQADEQATLADSWRQRNKDVQLRNERAAEKKIHADFTRSQIAAVAETEIVAKKAKLASFWVPSEAPQAIEAPKTALAQTVCPFGDHPLSLKSLTDLHFILKEDSISCPICIRPLTNAMRIVALRDCGHVLCKSCADAYVEGKSCPKCDVPVKRQLELATDGTGFSARGRNTASKYTHAFQ